MRSKLHRIIYKKRYSKKEKERYNVISLKYHMNSVTARNPQLISSTQTIPIPQTGLRIIFSGR